MIVTVTMPAATKHSLATIERTENLPMPHTP
jgi:hypothetical protein